MWNPAQMGAKPSSSKRQLFWGTQSNQVRCELGDATFPVVITPFLWLFSCCLLFCFEETKRENHPSGGSPKKRTPWVRADWQLRLRRSGWASALQSRDLTERQARSHGARRSGRVFLVTALPGGRWLDVVRALWGVLGYRLSGENEGERFTQGWGQGWASCLSQKREREREKDRKEEPQPRSARGPSGEPSLSERTRKSGFMLASLLKTTLQRSKAALTGEFGGGGGAGGLHRAADLGRSRHLCRAEKGS